MSRGIFLTMIIPEYTRFYLFCISWIITQIDSRLSKSLTPNGQIHGIPASKGRLKGFYRSLGNFNLIWLTPLLTFPVPWFYSRLITIPSTPTHPYGYQIPPCGIESHESVW